jgi:hypothetical protein
MATIRLICPDRRRTPDISGLWRSLVVEQAEHAMDRTKRLLALIAASCVLASNGSRYAAAVDPPTPAADQARVSAETIANANKLEPKLAAKTAQQALSVDDLLRQPDLPTQDRVKIEAALEYLVYIGMMRRTGDGSASQPFRYFGAETFHG